MKTSRVLPLTVALLVMAGSAAPAGRRATLHSARRAVAPARLGDFDIARHVDANQLNLVVTNMGSFGWDLSTGNAGLWYPNGTSKTVLFAGGLWVGAMIGGQVHMAVSEYSQEFGPGPMTGTANWANPQDPRFITYKVSAWTGKPDDTTHVTRVPADPTQDPLVHHSWSEYLAGAAPFGAPTRVWRLPNTATPDPNDSVSVLGPDVPGDQMLWCVYNDADPSNHTNGAGGTSPLGIEVRQMMWTMPGEEPLQKTIFLRWTILNHGVNTLDAMRAGVWLDPDLGGFTDDVAGCDSARGLGFVYNGRPNDAMYGATPPAFGVDMLSGLPGSAGSGGMSVFEHYVNGTDPASAQQSYGALSGLRADGSPMVNPFTLQPTRYDVSGDPVTGTGWLDTTPADKRMLLATGPATLTPGQSVTVQAALVVGQGGDAVNSVAVLRCDDDYVQYAWDHGFHDLPPFGGACAAVENCPRPPGYWASECGTQAHLTAAQQSAIAARIDATSNFFDWSNPLASFCALEQPGGDVRAAAEREYGALLASVAAGALGEHEIGGDPILLNLAAPVSCPAQGAAIIADLVAPAVKTPLLLAAFYDDRVLAHPPPIGPINAGLEEFGGGAGYGSSFLGSTIDPAVQPDSFGTVVLTFSHSATQKAYRYLRLERASDGSAPPQGRSYLYAGYRDVAFTAADSATGRQLDVAFVERAFTDDFGTLLPAVQQPAEFDSTWLPSLDASGLGREYLFVLHRPYSAAPKPAFQQDGAINTGAFPVEYAMWVYRLSPASVFDDGDEFHFTWGIPHLPSVDQQLWLLQGHVLDDSTRAAYQGIIDCIAPLVRGQGLPDVCDVATDVLASLIEADALPGEARIVWGLAPDGRAAIERSVDGASWTPLGTHTADHAGRLAFTDSGLAPGRHGYRLRLFAAGAAQTAGEVWVDVPSTQQFGLAGFVRNPADGAPAVAFTLPVAAPARLELLDVSGRRVWSREVGGLGIGRHEVAVGAGLAPGIYLVRLTQGAREARGKGVVVR